MTMDNNNANAKEEARIAKAKAEIEIATNFGAGQAVQWICLDIDEENKQALLITKDCVAQKPYHEKYEAITWEFCTLRKWLNTSFYSSLSERQRRMVKETEVVNTPNPGYPNVPSGNNIKDRIFLLSLDEVRFFANDASRIAKYKGEAAWWWLRSPGAYAIDAANVYGDGGVFGRGLSVDNAIGGVRPALYLNLESLIV
jgi:hypothetical protein